MFEFNRDAKTRDEMIFGEYDEGKYMGGTRRFEGISLDLLKKLMEMNYIDPDDAQNSSPTVQELVNYAEAWDGYMFSGYVVSIDRCDYRISIDEISKAGPVENDEVIKFTKAFRYANEFYNDGNLYAWWD